MIFIPATTAILTFAIIRILNTILILFLKQSFHL
jgi:hypothetical protein